MARWNRGESGNPQGRPREGTAIVGLARSQVQKYKLIEKLGQVGAPARSQRGLLGAAGEQEDLRLFFVPGGG